MGSCGLHVLQVLPAGLPSQVVPDFGSDQALLSRLLVCHRALGNLEPMATLYKSRLEEMPADDPK